MEFVDTHCHIHEALYDTITDSGVQEKWAKAGSPDAGQIIDRAIEAGVSKLVCVGTSTSDSEIAVDFAQNRNNVWASIGIHPHEAKHHIIDKVRLHKFSNLLERPKVVAIGECGLDYFYNHSGESDQIKLLEFQLQQAQDHDLPVIFHVRNAFKDFWPVYDNFKGLRGVLHSFTDTSVNSTRALDRGLHIGLNGIMTFTKDTSQLAMAAAVPLDKLLIETDAPFLTPAPERGKICQPHHLVVTAEFLAKIRGEDLVKLAEQTTLNANKLFRLN